MKHVQSIGISRLASLAMCIVAACATTGCLYGPVDQTVVPDHTQPIGFSLEAVAPSAVMTLVCSPVPLLGTPPSITYQPFATATSVTNGGIFAGTTIYSATTNAVVPAACWNMSAEFFGWQLGGSHGTPPPLLNTYVSAMESNTMAFTLSSTCVGTEVRENKTARTIADDCQLKDAQGNARGNRLLATQ